MPKIKTSVDLEEATIKELELLELTYSQAIEKGIELKRLEKQLGLNIYNFVSQIKKELSEIRNELDEMKKGLYE